MKNIFVGNLSFNTSEDELRQMFEPFGQVDRVSIMTDRDTGRSRGFGFVEMASNEDGEKAITALNGSQVGGRTLNVNEARPKTEHAGGGGRDRGGRGGDRGGDRGGAAAVAAATDCPQFKTSRKMVLAIAGEPMPLRANGAIRALMLPTLPCKLNLSAGARSSDG